MGIISFFVGLAITLLILCIILPHIIFKILKGFLQLQYSELKIYNLNHYKGIFLKTSNDTLQMWGFKSIILNIPEFIFKINKFKIQILINRMQIFMIKENLQLHRIRMIDGMMEPNLIMNFMSLILQKANLKQFLEKQLLKKKQSQKTKKDKQKQKEIIQKPKNRNRFLIILEGSIQFLIMMFLQQFQIIFQEASLNITSSIPQNQLAQQILSKKEGEYPQYTTHNLNFSSPSEKKQSLLLLEYLAQQTLLIPKIEVKVQIINHHQQQIQIYISQYQVINWQHVNEPLLQGKQIKIGIQIPFMLVFKQAIKRIEFKIQVQEMKFDTIPQDYQILIKFIKLNKFKLEELFYFQKSIIIKQDNEQNLVKVHLDIQNVCVKLHSLYQISHDSLEAKQYLSNIKEAVVNLQSISLKQKKFQIKNANLSVSKFCQKLDSSLDMQIQIQTSMIQIPNLIILIQESSVTVTHQQARLICGRQEVTLLGKLFILINNRMSLDEYQIMQYRKACQKYLQFKKVNEILLKNNIKKTQKFQKLTKDQWIDYLFYFYYSKQLNIKGNLQNNKSFSVNQKKKSFKYIPQSLHFRLKVQKLQHQLILTNSSYQQISCLGEAKHFLKVNSLILAYLGVKQFGISKLDFIFRQISTLHELGLFIENIQMKQNQLTLIEYLCGWTVLKKLLQLTQNRGDLDEEYQQITNQHISKGKQSKKTISIKRINFEYNQQTVIVKQLKVEKNTLPNGKTSKLYFSLDRCQLNSLLQYNSNNFKRRLMENKDKNPLLIKKIINEQSKDKKLDIKNKNKQNNISSKQKMDNFVNFTLFSIDSVTINTSLKIFQKKLLHHKSIQKQKERSLIHIKNPQICLPYFDASYKLMEYLKTYAEMYEYVEAYLKNVTDDQIVKIRKNIREFLIQPESVFIKITQFGIIIEQLPMDNHLQNFNRLIREYLSKIQYQNLIKISELQIISNIIKIKKKGLLCSLKIQQISFQINPFDCISSGDKQSVSYWIQNFYKKLIFKRSVSQASVKKIQSQQIRLRRVFAQNYKVQIKNLEFQLRDYPKSILFIESINSELSKLTTSNIFNSKKHFFLGNLNIGKIEANIGLGMLSGFLQILNKFNCYLDVIDKFKQTQDFLNAFKSQESNKKLININRIEKGFQPWWHILFYSSQWNLKVMKQPTVINVYTGITPYCLQHFSLQIGKFEAQSQREFTQLLIRYIKIKLQEVNILSLQNLKFNTKFIYDENLNFSIKLETFTQQRGQIVFHKKTIDFITDIKQLRKDWLLIFGLGQNVNNQLITQNKQLQKNQIGYLQIVSLAANNMLQKGQKKLSFFSVLKEIQLNLHINDFQASIGNNMSYVQLCIKNFNFSHQVFVHHPIICKINSQNENQSKSNWQILKSNLQMQTITGKYSQQKQASLPKQKQMSKQKQKQKNNFMIENSQIIFLVAQQMQIKFNQYMTINNQLVYVKKYMSNRSLKTYVSGKIKKALEKLVSSFSTQKIVKFANQIKQNKKVNILPIDRFRKVVYKVMKINKLNRLKKQNCKIYNFYSNFKSIQVIMESNKNNMILSSQRQSSLAIFTQYRQNDILYDFPFEHIAFNLKKAIISIDQNKSKKKRNSQAKQEKKVKQINKVSFSQQLSVQINILQNDKIDKYQMMNSEIYQEIQAYSKGRVTLKQGSIELTPKNKNLLKQFSQFIIEITDNKEQKKKQFKRTFDKYGQMMRHGRQKLKGKIQWNHSDIIQKEDQIISFKWTFQLKRMSITLYNQIKQNIKIQYGQTAVITSNKPFLQIQSENISLNLILFDNEKIKTNIQVNNLRIFNLLQKLEASEYRQMLSLNVPDKLAISLAACSYNIKAFSDLDWDYFNDIHVHLNPIKIKFTEELYEVLYSFLFPDIEPNSNVETKQNQTIKDPQQDQYGSYVPDYIKKLNIDQVKLQIWYRTDSVLKRMDGISVNVKQFSLSNEFLTKKQTFDLLVKFLLKQLAGQIFNVIGQKIFGKQ